STGRSKYHRFAAGGVLKNLLREFHLDADVFLVEHIEPAMLVAVQADGLAGAAYLLNLFGAQITTPIELNGGDKKDCASFVAFQHRQNDFVMVECAVVEGQ